MMLYFFYLSGLLISQYSGSEYVKEVFVQKGDNVRLNCTGLRDRGIWSGPHPKKETVVYFQNYKRNPLVKDFNIDLDVDNSSGHYDLLIHNMSIENEGRYLCYLLNGEDSEENKFLVSLAKYSTTDEFETTEGHKANIDNKYKKLPVYLSIGFGGLILLFICFTVLRFYQTNQQIQITTPSPEVVQYDEIDPINYNTVYPEVASRSGSSLSSLNINDSSRSSSQISGMIMETDGYENQYQTLIQEHAVENPYTNPMPLLMATGETRNSENSEDKMNYSFSSFPLAMENLRNFDFESFMKLVAMEGSSSSSSQASILVGETDGYENPYQSLSEKHASDSIYTNCNSEPMSLPNTEHLNGNELKDENCYVENTDISIKRENNQMGIVTSDTKVILGECNYQNTVFPKGSITPHHVLFDSVQTPFVRDIVPVVEDDQSESSDKQSLC